jgi:hypothetical protein
VGSEGHYDCKLLRAETNRTALTTSGEAVTGNGDVVLTIKANLQEIPKGNYTLALLRTGLEWTYYPATIK